MSTVADTQSNFWAHHFTKLAADPQRRGIQLLDHSQTPLAVQTYAFALEACGEIQGKHVLDCGFGTGELARILEALGGAVDAIDLVKKRIPGLREAAPSIYWSCADLSGWTLPPNGTPYDLIVACEVLQFVNFDDVTANLIAALNDAGRLMIIIPNADCPTVQTVAKRFQHQYAGISGSRLQQRFARYAHQVRVCYRGLRFHHGLSPVPYVSDPWSALDLAAPAPLGLFRHRADPPNRLQIVISKFAQGSPSP